MQLFQGHNMRLLHVSFCLPITWHVYIGKYPVRRTWRATDTTFCFSYNIRERDISALDIAIHRALAVIVGVLWAAIVSRFWWPSEARKELSKSLGEYVISARFQLSCILIWCQFLPQYWMALYPASGVEFVLARARSSERSGGRSGSLMWTWRRCATKRLNPWVYGYVRADIASVTACFQLIFKWHRELHLQIKLIELQGLLAQTQHEPRLKGPFPVHLYRNILTSLQTILDRMHSMRCVTTKEEW